MYNPGQSQQITDPETGKVWTLSRLEIKVIRAFSEWIKKREGDPYALVERWQGKIPEADLMALFKEAKETADQLRCFSLACPLAGKHLATEEGEAELFRLLLLEHHPSVTIEEAWGVRLLKSVREMLQTAEGTPAKNADAPPEAAA